MQIDLVIDVVCPWCYLGKKQLDAALARAPGSHDMFIRPYQLNPDMPAEGVDRADYYRGKFGDKAKVAAVRAHLAQAGAIYGIEFDWEKKVTLANTMDAHRVIKWGQGVGLGSEVADAIMYAYFTEGAFLGDPGLLADIAGNVGMDRALVSDLLAGKSDMDAIAAEVHQARQMGIQGVPATVIGGAGMLSGAQEPEIFLKAISEVEAHLGSQTDQA